MFFEDADAEYSFSATKIVAPATLKALSLAEIKRHLNISCDSHDLWLKDALEAAGKFVESKTNRALLDQEWDALFDRFPTTGGFMELPKPSLLSVTSVKYTDTAGAEQTWPAAQYIVDNASERGRIYEQHGFQFPTPRVIRHAVVVRFKAGFATAADVPQDLKLAMLMLIGHWFNNRPATNTFPVTDVPIGVDSLLADHVSQRFF